MSFYTPRIRANAVPCLSLGAPILPQAFSSGISAQDYHQAAAFLAAIGIQPNEPVNFRFIHDTDKAVPAIKRRGTLDQHWPEALQWQAKGYGIFITISQIADTGDRLTDVQSIRAHYVDLDGITAEADLSRATAHSPTPAFYVNSSPGKYHVYWPLAQRYQDNAWFDQRQRQLAQLFNGDHRVHDATRVMRLPGTLHLKAPTAPHLVTCAALPGYGQPVEPLALAQSVAHVSVVQHSGGVRHPLGTPELAAPGMAWLERALAAVDPNDLNRDEWISFTAAFKQAAWTITGPDVAFFMWSDWCARYDKNDPQENWKQWFDLTETQVGWPAIERRAGLHAERIFGGVPAVHQQPGKLLTPVSQLISRPHSARWLIKGILPATSAGIMFGQPGTGKSFVAIDMAASVASGTPFNGQRVQAGPVIYIAGEGHAGVSNRFAAKFKKLGSTTGSENIHVSNRAISFTNDQAELQALVTEIDGLQTAPALIVIDTLFRATAGSDINDHAEMAKFWKIVDGLKERYGATILVVHHSGRNETQRSFGSVVLLANADFEISVANDENGIRVLENTKQKDAEIFAPIAFTLDKVEVGIIKDQFDQFEHVTSCVVNFIKQSASDKIRDRETRKKAIDLDTPTAKSGQIVAALLAKIHDLVAESKGIGKGSTPMSISISRKLLKDIYDKTGKDRHGWRNGLKNLSDPPGKGTPWVDLNDNDTFTIRAKTLTYGRAVEYDEWDWLTLNPEEISMCRSE